MGARQQLEGQRRYSGGGCRGGGGFSGSDWTSGGDLSTLFARVRFARALARTFMPSRTPRAPPKSVCERSEREGEGERSDWRE